LAAPDAALENGQLVEQWQHLLDRCPIAILVHEKGRIVHVNAAAIEWVGAASAADLVGHAISEWVRGKSRAARPVRDVALQLDAGASELTEVILACADGTMREVHAVSVPVDWAGGPAHAVMLQDLSVDQRAQAAQRYRTALVDRVTDAIIVTTHSGTVTSWNLAAEAIYRRSAQEALATPVSDAVGALVDPAAIIAAGATADTTHHAADESALTVRLSAVEIGDSYLLISSNRTELTRAASLFRTVVDSLAEGVVVFDKDGHITYVNPAALRLFGIDMDDLPSNHVDRLQTFRLYDENGKLVVDPQERPIMETLRTGQTIRDRLFGIDRPDGERVWMSGGTFLLNADDPEHRAVLLSVADVTSQRELNERLTYQAHHDHLTGLPNRAHVLNLLTDALQPRDDGGVAAVCYIDLDGLKAINDSLGHDAGDTAIQIAAQILRAALRGDDILGRLGGDEFVALLSSPTTRSDIEHVAASLHAALSQPLLIVNVTQRLSACIGIAVVGHCDPRTATQLLRDADHAMYRAKTTGRGQSYFFTDP
jgi:diguanylate cyclase (GGDEF)-like protein/PAS domain S-box-containing protein